MLSEVNPSNAVECAKSRPRKLTVQLDSVDELYILLSSVRTSGMECGMMLDRERVSTNVHQGTVEALERDIDVLEKLEARLSALIPPEVIA